MGMDVLNINESLTRYWSRSFQQLVKTKRVCKYFTANSFY